jgi:hypothetical protein
MIPPVTLKLDDDKAERARQNHDARIGELQKSPLAGPVVVSVTIGNGATVTVPHRLQRRPVVVIQSIIRGGSTPGLVREISRDDKFVTLSASGFGASISLDLVVS